MKRLLFFISVLFISMHAYGQQPYVQKLRGLAQVTFPGVPKTVEKEGTLYVYKDAEANIYMAQVSDMDKSAQDYLNNHLSDSIYDGYIKGVTGSGKAAFTYREPVTVQGLHGVNFGYKINIVGRSYYCYHHVFYVNDMVLSYSYWSLDSLARDDKKIQAYFGTFKLLITPDKLDDSNVAHSLAYKTGHVIGVFIVIIFIAGVIGLIAYFIIRATRKKQPPPTREYDGP